jgi:hypothetical protein
MADQTKLTARINMTKFVNDYLYDRDFKLSLIETINIIEIMADFAENGSSIEILEKLKKIDESLIARSKK